MRTLSFLWLEGCRRRVGREGKIGRVLPNSRFVNNLLDPLRSLARLPDNFTGGWRPTEDPDLARMIEEAQPANELLAVRNGILSLPDGLLQPSTPLFFAPSASPVPWLDDAPEPSRFLEMLKEIWPDDPDSRDTLQQIFGYVIGNDTNLHKVFGIIGPPRSGTSRMVETLRRIVGPDITCAPTLSSLGTRFGKEQLINKKLAIVPDARLGRYADGGEIVQTLLAISGEDSQTVERKNRGEWNGTLGTKFVFVSNELPSLGDASGAFTSRLLMLQLTRSFLGKEDPDLGDKLSQELPGILRWAVEGWQSLRRQGRFKQPESGQDALRVMRELSSDIQIFLEERCEIGPDFIVETGVLLEEYNKMRTELHQDHVASNLFGKRLRAACPTVRKSQPRGGTTRLTIYKGIKLKDFDLT